MKNLKHVGQVKSSGRRCLVAYRTLPGDAYNCLIIPTESLPDSYHDALMSLVESNSAQSSFELWEILERSTFPDGSTMLVSLHAKGFLAKVPTNDIEMIPNGHQSIQLSELNTIIAQQRGVSVQDLAIASPASDPNVQEVGRINNMPSPKPEVIAEPLSDEMLATKLRQDAIRLAEEVKSLLAQAEQLSPTIVAEPVVATTPIEVIPEVIPEVKKNSRKSQSKDTTQAE